MQSLIPEYVLSTFMQLVIFSEVDGQSYKKTKNKI